jgi:hypothetical protein
MDMTNSKTQLVQINSMEGMLVIPSDDDDRHMMMMMTMMTAEETMNRAMATLPDNLTAEYREACRWAPELVEKESDPRWFLR